MGQIRCSLEAKLAPALLGVMALILCLAVGARAGPVGERHLQATDTTAALRDSDHRPQVRVTVWYPAAPDAVDRRIDLRPPGHPLFLIGAVAPDAPFVDARARPVILFSHGFGGTARMMGWFGTALARAGYIVVAVDHPGNNGLDKMTIAGAVMPWDRVQDLRGSVLIPPRPARRHESSEKGNDYRHDTKLPRSPPVLGAPDERSFLGTISCPRGNLSRTRAWGVGVLVRHW